MNSRFFRIIISVCGTIILMLSISSSPVNSKEDKMKPEELVAKHIISIGTADAIGVIKNRIMLGNVEMFYKHGGLLHIYGISSITSENPKQQFMMVYNK